MSKTKPYPYNETGTYDIEFLVFVPNGSQGGTIVGTDGQYISFYNDKAAPAVAKTFAQGDTVRITVTADYGYFVSAKLAKTGPVLRGRNEILSVTA